MNKILFILSVITSVSAYADLTKTTVFTLNTIYLDRDYTTNGTQWQSKTTDTDLRLTRVEKSWAYGAIYSQSSLDASDSSRRSYGATVSYFSEKDFYLSASYYLSSTYSEGTAEYSKGSGYEFNVGFLSKITSSFYVGLMGAAKNFKYTEQNINGVKSSANLTHREVIPMFSFGIVFM